MTPEPPNMATSVGEWFRCHRNSVLLGFMAVLIPATFSASQLRTDNAIERWLGDDNPAVQTWEEFRQRFAIRPQITAVIDDILPTDPRIDRSARLLERLPTVSRVWTPSDLRKATGATQPTRLDTLLVPGGNSSTLWIELSDIAQRNSRETIRHLRLLIEECEIPAEALHLGGPLTINAALDYWSRQSLESLLPVVGFTCFALLWILRRNLFQSLLLSFSAGTSVLFTFAIMQLAGAKMDLLLVALPPLIGVLHLSVGIHLLHHFDAHQELQTGAGDDGSEVSAVSAAIDETFAPSSLATVTTIIGMLSLAVSDLGPVRGFGIWSAVGLLVSFVVAYTLLPCFLVEATFVAPARLSCHWFTSRFHRTRRLVFAGSALLLTVAVPGWNRLVPDFNAIGFLPAHSRTIIDYTRIEERCCGLVPVELDVDLSGIVSGQDRFRILEELGQRLKQHPHVTSTLSAVSFVSGNPVADELLRNWQSLDRNHFRVSALVRSDADRELQDIVADIHESCGNLPVTMTGLVSLINDSQHAIYESLRDSLLTAIALVSVILVVLLRSIPAGLMALIPNVGPIVIGFGLVGWLDMPLDVGTVLTASIALGVALDDSLHFVHQFRRARGRSADVELSVRESWQVCAWPMIQTSVVAAIGLAILSFSEFRPVARFGQLMATMLVLALLADLVLLPYMLTTWIGRLFPPLRQDSPTSDRDSAVTGEQALMNAAAGHDSCSEVQPVETYKARRYFVGSIV